MRGRAGVYAPYACENKGCSFRSKIGSSGRFNHLISCIPSNDAPEICCLDPTDSQGRTEIPPGTQIQRNGAGAVRWEIEPRKKILCNQTHYHTFTCFFYPILQREEWASRLYFSGVEQCSAATWNLKQILVDFGCAAEKSRWFSL